jgi:NADH-quinone oxidoreductase subunit L
VNQLQHYLWLLPALPLLGAILNGTLSLASTDTPNGPSRGLSGFIGTMASGLAFVLTAVLALSIRNDEAIRQVCWTWIDAGSFKVNFGFAFDSLTAMMLLFITGIGTLIHLYSIGYMAEDRGFARFFAYLNLFMASMIVLVLGSNMLMTFIGWEGVGLCSYLLIGFWHHEPANGDAARKAFLVNRAGDLGFLLGAFALMALMGSNASLEYSAIAAWFRDSANASILASGTGAGLLTAACLLIFLGCTGKSAQIPLLTWLPDAMAGPTPVSALIHAATMVTSGVYLISRMSDMFVRSPLTMSVVAGIGIATALWAAIAGLFQNDIKKVLAYSTVSQLGFMFVAAGIGAFDAALFHVFTHAFFKAALFLGSGSVIHALHGEQDIRKMGGLWKKLPLTFGVMAAGWYAILGLPLGAGFWSKDLILEKAFVHSPLLYVLGLSGAVITALYMTRLMVLTFFGKSRDEHAAAHAHEAPVSMAVPLLILGLGAVGAGFFWAGMIPGMDAFQVMISPVLSPAQGFLSHGTGEHHVSALLFAAIGTLAALVGATAAWKIWGGNAKVEAIGSSAPKGFGAHWTNLFDYVHALVIWPTKAVSWIFDKVVQTVVFGGSIALVQFIVELVGDCVRSLQRPRLRVNLGLSLAGLLAVLAFFLLGAW